MAVRMIDKKLEYKRTLTSQVTDKLYHKWLY